MPKPIAGTCFFKVDGTQYSIAGNVSIGIGNIQRESLVGLDGFHGIKEVPQPGFIEVQIRDYANLDLNAVEKLSDVTVTVNMINGKTALLRNAHQVNKLEMNPEDGTVTLRFEGPKGEYLTA